MYISSLTPPMEPGMLPTASAMTTLRRTVPFVRCKRPAGIFVKKLNSASEPTATIGGTLRPKIRINPDLWPEGTADRSRRFRRAVQLLHKDPRRPLASHERHGPPQGGHRTCGGKHSRLHWWCQAADVHPPPLRGRGQ